MKKSVLISTLICAVSSASAFAHHPAADIVDPEIYAMIDENVADTPHAELTFDDMGSRVEQLDTAIEAAGERSEMAAETSEAGSAGEMRELTTDSAADGEMADSAAEMLDTIGILDSVVGQLAE